MEGMQRAGVLANGKHFPGHGDTDKDSHKTLPTIAFSKERIDSIELYPFKQLIDKNLASVMVAHLKSRLWKCRLICPLHFLIVSLQSC